jgi:hypothetical protein
MSALGRLLQGIDSTLIQRFSSHCKTLSLVRLPVLQEDAIGFKRVIASRFMARSSVAYRLVVVALACPSHWLTVTDRSTPDFSRATAVLWRMLCGCSRFRARLVTAGRTLSMCLAKINEQDVGWDEFIRAMENSLPAQLHSPHGARRCTTTFRDKPDDRISQRTTLRTPAETTPNRESTDAREGVSYPPKSRGYAEEM